MGELMQADLAKVGINVNLITFDWAEYLKRMHNGESPLGQIGWGRRYRRSGQLHVPAWLQRHRKGAGAE